MTTKLDELNSRLVQSPLNRWLGCSITGFDVTTGMVELLLPDRPELHRHDGAAMAHGGVIAALVDIAAHAVLYAKVGRAMPTIDLRVDYLKLAELPLRARAIPRRAGRTIGFADVEIMDCNGLISALGRAVFLTQKPPVSGDNAGVAEGGDVRG